MPLDKLKFIRKHEGLGAHICKDVPPKQVRGKKKELRPVPDSSKNRYQKTVLKIPDEYAFALQEMYSGKGLQGAIMEHIRSTVTPVKLDE